MTDRELLAVAASMAVAAAAAVAVPWWALVAAAALASLVRHPIAAAAVAVVVTSALGARAEAGLDAGPSGPVRGWLTLVTDPAPSRFSTTAIGRFDGHLVLVDASTPDASARLGPLLAGQRLLMDGRARRIDRPTHWQRSRHLSSRLALDTIDRVGSADALWGSANVVRRWLTEGSATLGPERQSLFAGLVIGDDRDQSVRQQHAFRASGLAHLLAVSGQNVAFVLLVASPLTARLMLRGRLLAVLVVLGWFVVLTRFEPSVLRSVAMASVAATSALVGRRSSGLRVLSIAVGGVILLDPLIVWSFGFRLSVAASIGLVLWARSLGGAVGRSMKLPRPLAAPLGVTLAATAGTAPLLVAAFGVVPAIGPLANLLAVPIAGAVMVWGMSAGVIAGIAPALAPALHLPTRTMLWWIDRVASLGADPRWPRLNFVGVVVIVAAVLAWTAVRRRRLDLIAVPLAIAIVASGVVLLRGVAAAPPGTSAIVGHAELRVQRAVTLLVIRPGVDAGELLDALDARGVASLDAVVVTRQRSSSAAAASLVRHLYAEVPVIAPPGELIDRATILTRSVVLRGIELRRCADEIVVGQLDAHRPAVIPLACPP